MKIEKLFSMQNELNTRIVKEHNLENVSLSDKRRLAFLVELGELANETRCFKYWSKRPASEKEVILEEYVDGLHFVLSIGLELGFTEIELPIEVELTEKMDKIELNHLFLSLYQWGAKSLLKQEFNLFLNEFLGLGVKLGFSFQEIEAAYLNKNAVNHERQDSGY
ncbi:dUTP diphosphatase [Fictibacillus sp. NPDC058756]|uniref:dUTP diphosphatase n=1 Tax=Fictibacillus sp. NPDC058756 TaxID=3346625 RepID=UPI0036BFFBD7